MKNILAILSILILTFNAVGQFDSLYWQNGNVKQIREYYKYNKYNIKAYHSNGSLNYAGHCSLLSGTEYSMTVEAAFDKNGDITVEEGNGILLCYDDDLKLLSTTNFRNKVRFSEYIEYYSSGTIKIKGSYGGLNGVLDKHKQGIW